MSPTESSREENVYMAKLAEQVERYEEIVDFMEKVAKIVDVEELTVEERNILFGWFIRMFNLCLVTVCLW